MQKTVTPITTPEQVLASASSEELLDKIVILTHKVHGSSKLDPPAKRRRDQELREQRDMLRAEVLRRIGGAR